MMIYKGYKLFTDEELQEKYDYKVSTNISDDWETQTINVENTWAIGWNLQKFFINKTSKLVTGLVGLTNSNRDAHNKIFKLDKKFGLHSSFRNRRPGHFVYGTLHGNGNPSEYAKEKNTGFEISTEGLFTLYAGFPLSNLSSHLESFVYLGSEAKIYSEPPKKIYLPQGAFWDSKSMEMMLGEAWYKKVVEKPKYLLIFYKNFFTGEVILDYLFRNINSDSFSVSENEYLNEFAPKDDYFNGFKTPIKEITPVPEDFHLFASRVDFTRNSTLILDKNKIKIMTDFYNINSQKPKIRSAIGTVYYHTNPSQFYDEGDVLDTTPKFLPIGKSSSSEKSKYLFKAHEISGLDLSRILSSSFVSSLYDSQTTPSSYMSINPRNGMIAYKFDIVNASTSGSQLIQENSLKGRYIGSNKYPSQIGEGLILFSAGAVTTKLCEKSPQYHSFTDNIYIRSAVGRGTESGVSVNAGFGTRGGTTTSLGNEISYYGFYLGNTNKIIYDENDENSV